MTLNEPDELKKGRTRSPNYPAIGLREAVGKVEALYQADKKAGAPIDAALRHMGFNTRNGKAMVVLSALKKFGLVEEASGRIVPTKRAVEIIVLPEHDPRRLVALKEAALGPDIYRELVEQYKDTGMPSDQSLMAELEAYKGFNPSAVEDFVADFRDTLNFSGLTKENELSSGLEEQPPMVTELRTTHPQKPQPPASLVTLPQSTAGTKAYSWPLSGDVNASLRIDGEPQAEDLELLRDYIEITIKALKRKRTTEIQTSIGDAFTPKDQLD